jgi:hypothetical protein
VVSTVFWLAFRVRAVSMEAAVGGAAKAEVAARVREISRRGVRLGFTRDFLK